MDRFKSIVVTALAVMSAAGCTERTLTEPPSETVDASPVAFIASFSAVQASSLDFDADLNNIVEQVVPGFADAEAGQRLVKQLDLLKAHLSAGDRASAAEVIKQARSAMTPDVSNRTDLGYIEMVFYNIDAALVR